LLVPAVPAGHLLGQFEERLTGEVRAVICNHVSNVFGYILPVEEIARLCRRRKVPFILDASQSAGCLPIDFEGLGRLLWPCPDTRVYTGRSGTGLLLCRNETVPVLEGGTGSVSLSQKMPDFLPDRLEAGTHNIPGAAGLLEGIRFVRRKGTSAILHHERMLVAQAYAGLKKLEGVKVFASADPKLQAGVLAFQLSNMDCEDAGAELSRREIAVRAGLHCAPLAHNSAGTLEKGAVRVSFSAFNTAPEVDVFLRNMEN
jgi:selenocysteine lyase/cysteine desulfurase